MGEQLDEYIIVGIDGISFLDHGTVYAAVTDPAIGLHQREWAEHRIILVQKTFQHIDIPRNANIWE